MRFIGVLLMRIFVCFAVPQGREQVAKSPHRCYYYSATVHGHRPVWARYFSSFFNMALWTNRFYPEGHVWQKRCRDERNVLWSLQIVWQCIQKEIPFLSSLFQEETFDGLVEWWVLQCVSRHWNLTSRERIEKNNDLSFYSVSCFTQL